MSQHFFDRRTFLAATSSAVATTLISRPLIAEEAVEQPKFAWHDVTQWGVEGKGWQETARYFDRLPAKAEKLVRPAVWNLSRHSAGMLCRFETDATSIRTRYELLSESVAMAHMPATGVSGVDLYARDAHGEQRWVGVTRPAGKKVDAKLAKNLDPPLQGMREFTAYLPLYNGVEALEFGVPEGATFKPIAPRDEKPLVFYGTSIMHGACASRPGMSITGIVGRRLDRPVINLGFSGNGRMEAELAHLLSELNAAVYLIDCLPNINGQLVAERTEPLVHILREARPDTPIVLVEDRTYGYAHIYKASRTRHAESRAALAKAYENLQNEGIKHLHYLSGDSLLSDGDSMTDGSHPNDMGMVQYATAYQAVLEKILL
ncbi:MAG: hypothetical protein GXP24_00155 [Planctomycetes bacterium]|nr:hypothetical protein [Planctomycetota bacterium]